MYTVLINIHIKNEMFYRCFIGVTLFCSCIDDTIHLGISLCTCNIELFFLYCTCKKSMNELLIF